MSVVLRVLWSTQITSPKISIYDVRHAWEVLAAAAALTCNKMNYGSLSLSQNMNRTWVTYVQNIDQNKRKGRKYEPLIVLEWNVKKCSKHKAKIIKAHWLNLKAKQEEIMKTSFCRKASNGKKEDAGAWPVLSQKLHQGYQLQQSSDEQQTFQREWQPQSKIIQVKSEDGIYKAI